MFLNFFRKCGISLPLLPLILAICFTTGCIQSGIQDNPSQEKALSSPSGETSPIRLEIDYDSAVSSSLFRTKGCLVLWGNRSLPYLILNATLLMSGRPVSSTKYMMIEIEPNKEDSFDISKNMRISPGSYSCILDVSGPSGQLISEARGCSMMEPFFTESPAPEPKLESKPKTSSAQQSPSKEEPLKAGEKSNDSSEGLAKAREEELSMPSGSPEKLIKSPERTKSSGKVSSDNVSYEEDENLSQKVIGSNGSKNSLEGRDQESDVSEPGADADTLQDGSLVGSTTSNKYHLPSCRYATKIRPENRAYFANEEEAKRKGYNPCKTCNP